MNFFETKKIIAPLSTNVGLIHKGITKTKWNISKLDDLSAFSLMFLPEEWSSLQGKFWIKCPNLFQKIALYQGFALFSAIFNLHYTGDRTNWNRTNRRPPVLSSKKNVSFYLDLIEAKHLMMQTQKIAIQKEPFIPVVKIALRESWTFWTQSRIPC